ncbi:Hypothetical protein AA314_08754 [Archangium gephyra]|nr:Hypothetical protein AA314_08754 [Archangium gephyra]
MAEPVEGSEPGAEQEVALATVNQELLSAGEFYWDQYRTSATAMGSMYDRVCFLSRMTGNFAGGGESIHAFTTGGSWYLGGSSMQEGVGASAQCAYVPYGTYSDESYWWQHTSPNYPIYMGSATNRVCFLTGISGGFRGWGEWVHVYVSGGSWYLSGNSQQTGVAARARCVSVNSYSNESYWHQNQKYATYLSPAAGKTCALTYVQGHFRGGGESVNIFQSGGSWYLGGSSMQHDVAAKARCF